MVLFGVFFSATSLTKSMGPILLRDPPKWLKHIPSGIALCVRAIASRRRYRNLALTCPSFPSRSAIGFLNTPSFSIARLLGGLIALRFSRHGKVPLIGAHPSLLSPARPR